MFFIHLVCLVLCSLNYSVITNASCLAYFLRVHAKLLTHSKSWPFKLFHSFYSPKMDFYAILHVQDCSSRKVFTRDNWFSRPSFFRVFCKILSFIADCFSALISFNIWALVLHCFICVIHVLIIDNCYSLIHAKRDHQGSNSVLWLTQDLLPEHVLFIQAKDFLAKSVLFLLNRK